MEKEAWDGGVRRRVPAYDAGVGGGSSPAGHMHQPGKPIGFLAARNTPYAKKVLSKRLILFTIFILPILIIFNLFLICVPILWGVANHTLAVSVMHIYASNITAPTEHDFIMTLEGQVKKAGVFPAQLYFREPLQVFWNTVPTEDKPMREVELGRFPLDRVGIAAGHGRIKQLTRFNITDLQGFTEFTEYLVQAKEFTWRLDCPNVHIEAFAFLPTIKNLKLTKYVILNGLNNFENVKILDFKLPGADPEGGISYQALTSLENPSPFGMQLGIMTVNLHAYDMSLGPGMSTPTNLTQGTNYVTLTGRLLPKNDSNDLSKLSDVFTRYINHDITPTIAEGTGLTNPDHPPPSWLAAGIKVLRLNVPFQSPEPINPVKQIVIKTFNLTYPPGGDDYSPLASSDALTAELAVPFGFPLRVVSAKNEITLINQQSGKPITTVNGINSAADTQLNIVSTQQTEGTLFLTLKPSPMMMPAQTDEARKEFDFFQKEFAFSKEDVKLFNGSAKTLTETPVGTVLLNGIKFSVESGLLGLQGLSHYPTLVLGVDVVGGTREGIDLKVNTSIYNPSNVNLNVGDTTLLMVNEIVLGSVTLPKLNLVIGNNTLIADTKFNPNAGPQGYDMLNRYISGIDTKFNISGYEDSTKITSLKPAFSAVRVNTTLPGLKTKLIKEAQLKVLASTGNKDDVAQTIVSLDNPFTSPLTITHIKSNVTSHGIFVATLDTDTNYNARGKGTSQSPLLDLHLNLYPPDIFALVRAYAKDAGLDVRPLDGVVAIGGYTYSKTTDANTPQGNQGNSPSRRSTELELTDESNELTSVDHVLHKRKTNMFTGFNIVDFTDKAFASALVNLEIMSASNIGDYQTELTFAQTDVALKVDQTIHMLLPVLAKPIVQKIIDGSILAIKNVVILDPKPTSFVTAMKGSITNSGPFDAKISFRDGLQISWNGKVLGQLKMPDISLVAEEGAQLDIQAEFAVADVDALTEFTKFLMLEPSFIWNIQGKNLAVSALGITVDGLDIAKTVILTGVNGLKNDVKVSDYDLPYNDPAGGIHLTAQSVVTNPSQVGVELSRFGISVWSNGTNLGPSAAAHGFTLNPLSDTNLPLAGRLQRQTSDKDLKVLSTVFTNVVHGQKIPVEIRGEYAGPEDVKWLNEGVKALRVKTELPAKHFSVIKGVDIKQLTLMFSKNSPWKPSASSNNTEAPFYLPFQFPLDIKRTGGGFIENYKGSDIAILDIPISPAETQVQARILTLQFTNVPMAAYSSKHSEFAQFIADTTRMQCIKFKLHGNADAKASTAAGYVTVSDIPFNVDTSLLGLQNLNARPAYVQNLDVRHGYKSYLLITANSFLYNPSHLTVGTGDVSFDLLFKGRKIGNVELDDLVIEPGVNKRFTKVKYQPQGSENVAAGQEMLENYVQGIESKTIIKGTSGTTDIVSLKQALAGIELTVMIPPLHKLLIIEDRLVIPKNIAQTSTAQASFQLANPFTASINLLKIDAKAIYKGIFLGEIKEDLSKNPIRAPGHTTITSRSLPIKMDLRPKHLIQFIEQAAADTNTDLGPLYHQFDLVKRMKSTKTNVKPYPDSNPPNCHSGRQFDVFGAVFNLLKGLKVTLDIKSTVKLDDYQTDLNFKQSPVPTDTDETALYLIGPVGAPIVQNIVDGAKLSFSVANATKLTDDGFDVALQGQLLNTGPFDALIEFPGGLTVTWSGKDIATVHLPPVCAKADEGVPNYVTKGTLKITNQKAFTEFATYILHNPKFTWTVHSNKLRVRALNIIFNDVQISKVLNFDAFNNLPGVTISNFDIPGETNDALKIQTDSVIPSPASLGIQLDTANFKIFFQGRYQGPIHSTNLFLAAHASTSTVLRGFITSKSSDKDRNVTGNLFSGYLQGKNQTLEVKGDSVVTRANGNKPVKWLSTAFKTLTLKVILPGKIYEIVKSAQIIDLFVTMMESRDTWAPPTGSNMTLAQFANPLHFSLKPLKAGLDAVLTFQGRDAARLVLPLLKASAGTSHGPEDRQPLVVSFNNQRLRALDHGAFAALLTQILTSSRATFQLRGTVDIIGHMVIGDIPIKGIPFSGITSSLAGIDSFTRKLTVARADTYRATPEYLDLKVKINLTNPGNITIKTTGLRLPLNYKDVYMGRVLIDNKVVVPGLNNLDAIARYQPNNANDTIAQQLVQRYLQPQPNQPNEVPFSTPVQVQGRGFENANPPLSPFASLVPGLAQVVIDTALPGIGSRALQRIDALVDVLGLFAGPGLRPMIRIQLTFKNDITLSLEIINIWDSTRLTGSADEGPPDATFYVNYPSLIGKDVKCKEPCIMDAASQTKVNPGRRTCCVIPDVLLVKGLLASLKLIGNKLDTRNMLTARVGGSNGYTLPGVNFDEYVVPTTYALTIHDLPVINITSIQDFFNGLGKTTSKMNKDQKTRLAQGIKSANRDDVAKLVDNGMKDLICGVEELLPFDLLDLAGCKRASIIRSKSSASRASATSNQSSSANGSSSGGPSSAGPSKAQAAPSSDARSQAGNNQPGGTAQGGQSDTGGNNNQGGSPNNSNQGGGNQGNQNNNNDSNGSGSGGQNSNNDKGNQGGGGLLDNLFG